MSPAPRTVALLRIELGRLSSTLLVVCSPTLFLACGGKVLSDATGASEPSSDRATSVTPPNAVPPSASLAPATPTSLSIEDACRFLAARNARCDAAWDGWESTCLSDSRRQDCGAEMTRFYVCFAQHADTCGAPAACEAAYCAMERCNAPGFDVQGCD